MNLTVDLDCPNRIPWMATLHATCRWSLLTTYNRKQPGNWKIWKWQKKELGNLHVQPPCFILETIMVFSLSWPLTLLPASPRIAETLASGRRGVYDVVWIRITLSPCVCFGPVSQTCDNFQSQISLVHLWNPNSPKEKRIIHTTQRVSNFVATKKRQENNRNTYIEDIIDIHISYTYTMWDIHTISNAHITNNFIHNFTVGITSPSLTLLNLPSNSASTGTLKQFDAQNVKHRLGPLTCRDMFSGWV